MTLFSQHCCFCFTLQLERHKLINLIKLKADNKNGELKVAKTLEKEIVSIF